MEVTLESQAPRCTKNWLSKRRILVISQKNLLMKNTKQDLSGHHFHGTKGKHESQNQMAF